MEIRELTPDDREQVWRLSVESFGGPPPGSPLPEPPDPRALGGRHSWGAFEDDGRLLAQVVGFDFGSWFGGAAVPTCGIAGVAVSPEARGRGLLRPLFAAALEDHAERGQPLSTLFPTANGIYRSLGYELVSSFDTVAVPTAQLTTAPPVATTTRRATADDLPAVHEVYTAWASAQNGPLTRTGARFDVDDLLDGVTAVTLAVAGDRVTGFLSWMRGDSYQPDAVLTVEDLVAVDADAFRALWQVLASFASVTGTVRLTTSGDDPARHVLRTATWDVVARHPYMVRLLDLPGAMTALAAEPPLAPATVELTVVGDKLGLLDGTYVLDVGDGVVGCERTGPPAPRDDVPALTAGGVGLLWSGAQSCGNLRHLGHLTGPDHHDDVLDALFGGRQLHIRDYF